MSRLAAHTKMLPSLSLVLALGALRQGHGHPNNIQCEDPRIKEGAMMMKNYIVSNEYTNGLVFEASASSYSEGTDIHIQVKANGTKFLNPEDAPKGVFLSITSRSHCTLVGDHGRFSGVSEDLDYTPVCDSSVFSKTKGGAFNGKSKAIWTAGPGTKGNVTFTLLWSNGPGASDPLSVAGKVRVPDAYLYMKTITITGPDGPCPPGPPKPPAPAPGSPNQCVVSGDRCPMAGVGSPLIMQATKDMAANQVLPAGICVPCRFDYRGKVCESAMVSCPTEPGGALKELIWHKSKNCSGAPTRTAYLPAGGDVWCPGPEHYSVETLDMERFVKKLLRDQSKYFKDEATARKAIAEYRKMLLLVQKHPKNPVVPSKLVDLVWHEHILDTVAYERDTLRMFGRFIHHKPSFGGEEEKAELESHQQEMYQAYVRAFGEEPPRDMWPTAHKKKGKKLGAGGALPDCCSAKCVKPSCHDCVGCNSVDCGYLADMRGEIISGEEWFLPPNYWAGYVPASEPALKYPPPAEYACSMELRMPFDSPYKMSFDWSICNERLHARHSLKGLGAWFAIGLAGENQTDMGFGDYILTMMTHNYTGVKDMYKWDTGNGYPCWDVLHECSVGNKTKGTKDVENEQITRDNSLTTSTWSRKLKTADYKDRHITPGNMSVLFAHGPEDFFTYHEKHWAKCTMDFFAGAVDCKAAAAAVKRQSTEFI